MKRIPSLTSLCASLLVIGGLVASCTPFALPPTPTPTAFASPTVQPSTPGTPSPCTIATTRTPAPNAPTRAPSGPPVVPHVEICASATTLQVGDAVAIVGVPVDIGLPYYQLSLDGEPIVRVTYEGQVTRLEGTNAVFELVSAEGTMQQATFVLRARATGTVKAAIGTTGEIHYGYPGPATWAGGGSDPIQITVTE